MRPKVIGTKKPCPICGEKPSWRRQKPLCDECMQFLETGKAAAEAQEQRTGEGGKLVWVATPDYWPGVYNSGLGIEHNDPLRRGFDVLVRVVSEGPTETKGPYGFPPQRKCERRFFAERNRLFSSSGSTLPRAMPPAIVDAIEALDKAMRAALRAAYEAGIAKGSSTLQALADGRLTLGAFEEELKE